MKKTYFAPVTKVHNIQITSILEGTVIIDGPSPKDEDEGGAAKKIILLDEFDEFDEFD